MKRGYSIHQVETIKSVYTQSEMSIQTEITAKKQKTQWCSMLPTLCNMGMEKRGKAIYFLSQQS